jgi:hypothetical protein
LYSSYKTRIVSANVDTKIARLAFCIIEVAALLVCSGAATREAVLEPEGELKGNPEVEDALDVPLVPDVEAVYVEVSTM